MIDNSNAIHCSVAVEPDQGRGIAPQMEHAHVALRILETGKFALPDRPKSDRRWRRL
jgi:hypothetical protein